MGTNLDLMQLLLLVEVVVVVHLLALDQVMEEMEVLES